MPSRPSEKPSLAQIQAAANQTVPDIIAPDLKVLFCGINPSLYSAAVGHHFARPGNRFWPALAAAGITDRRYSPFEDRLLLILGYGITNIVERATARADQLTAAELEAGRHALLQKLMQYQPQILAILGISAYRTAFRQPKAKIGRQEDLPDDLLACQLWVLPNPSGLNAHYQLADLAEVYRGLAVNL
ncbi:MAG: G/U mismatch-specific DNA glycosylase [Pegethrix bostrychoides GSE-TBD4-15B]|jgi:TDG/mug DNA glycosylase family protein|uniref:G/U mismatch-specific DNA glycosylase n=1 Tax=Pegethrix bostrychoides GSE-TBD4-15B TaxID=2839662 RepID=A0A951PDJ8_9CYAN|nr:G/U mismatch-specific DNA glycosylase [Pegethrix bostrychoides GSE-TBD4-15B]